MLCFLDLDSRYGIDEEVDIYMRDFMLLVINNIQVRLFVSLPSFWTSILPCHVSLFLLLHSGVSLALGLKLIRPDSPPLQPPLRITEHIVPRMLFYCPTPLPPPSIVLVETPRLPGMPDLIRMNLKGLGNFVWFC